MGYGVAAGPAAEGRGSSPEARPVSVTPVTPVQGGV